MTYEIRLQVECEDFFMATALAQKIELTYPEVTDQWGVYEMEEGE